MADETLILDGHALADESVTGNFAPLADDRAALDFNERADTRAVADSAAVEIDEGVDLDAFAEFNV